MKKLLIVDDQQQYLDSLVVYLGKKFVVSTARTYEGALEELEKGVDVALIDIRLDENDEKNADGLRILEWMKINRPGTISFVMSAFREFDYAERALNLGAKHFFRKPIDVENLLSTILESC